MGDDAELTDDGFLGGRIRIFQPRKGYRAATDPVFLAASVAAHSGQSVLELGCGVGVASLCLAARVPGLRLCGIERQADYAALACRNAVANGVPFEVIEGSIDSLPAKLRASSFDHVIANPPYYRSGAGTRADDVGREAALREETPLPVWVDVAMRRLAPGGWLSMINLAERLPDILVALDGRAGSLAILPIAPRHGRAASRVVVRARKGGGGAARLLAPLIVHDGPEHLRDGDDYSVLARAILRDGAAVPGFD